MSAKNLTRSRQNSRVYSLASSQHEKSANNILEMSAMNLEPSNSEIQMRNMEVSDSES